ncbi:MAG: NUDIX hydrolase [Proteobacteria bacterium]|nr:NUDIX hydrolase [Pseudomonadota bacterium]
MAQTNKSVGSGSWRRERGYSYRHPHPAVAVDLTIFTVIDAALNLLLVRRGVEPFKNRWALPGGFVRIDEELDAAASRELVEETGVNGAYLKQVGAFGRINRDPRERVISIAYLAVIAAPHSALIPGTDAADAQWWRYSELPQLAFDHSDIVSAAHSAAARALSDSFVAYKFLPAEFTLTDVQAVYEAILGKRLDKRNFRKALAAQDLLRATGRTRRDGQHRPAALFRLRPGQENSRRHNL